MLKLPNNTLERFLLVWLVLASALAFVWSQLAAVLTGDTSAFDPFVASKPLLPYLIAATMFAIGCLLPVDEVRAVWRRWPVVFGGTAVQYTAMPLLAWSFASLFELDPPIRAGVILAGCVPGAMASNVLTLAARGNVSYSVSLTTSATLLSPLVVPIALAWTLGGQWDLDPLDESKKLLMRVVLPVVAGHFSTRCVPTFDRVMRPAGPVIANLVILWIIAVVVALNRERLSQTTAGLLWALLALNLCGYAVGTLAGRALRLDGPMSRALTLEVGMQNAGLGTVMALEILPAQSAIPTAAYTFGCMLTGTVLARMWRILDLRLKKGD